MTKNIRHPQIKTSLAIMLSRFNLARITLLYLVLITGLAVAFGFIFSVTRADRLGFGASFRLALASLWTTVDPLSSAGERESLSYYAAASCVTALSVILPLFLLGAFIFKLFRHDPLVWRQKVSVINYRGFGPSLHFRFYNGTIEELGNLQIEVFARISSASPPNLVVNRKLSVAAGDELLDGAYFGLSSPGEPITVTVPLNTLRSLDDVVDSDALQVQDATPGLVSKSRVEFLVVVKGTSLMTGENFTSVEKYPAMTTMTMGHYQDIEVNAGQDPKEWAGWKNFEGTRDIYVFAYGSLVSPAAVSSLLGYELRHEDGPVKARLRGWRRTWNVGSNDESHPERILTTEDGREYNGTLAYLGLEESADDYCNGAVIRVDNRDLAVLADRERLYYRQDVTSQVEWRDKPPHCLVLAFVPTRASLRRLTEAVAKRNVAVRAEYKASLERAFDALGPGQLDEYMNTTERCPYPIANISTSIDASRVPFAGEQVV